jgi:hypothetical protein
VQTAPPSAREQLIQATFADPAHESGMSEL